ncbi:MAG: hypothetical protein JNL38_25035 [Myxococcales bacterium]|nr:hypothetical protein [Myxococcales bacterium]
MVWKKVAVAGLLGLGAVACGAEANEPTASSDTAAFVEDDPCAWALDRAACEEDSNPRRNRCTFDRGCNGIVTSDCRCIDWLPPPACFVRCPIGTELTEDCQCVERAHTPIGFGGGD